MCCNPGGCCNMAASVQCTNFSFNCWTGSGSTIYSRPSCTPCCPPYRGCCGGPRGCC
ncbi:small cysteine and glycine repeat-containing protein 6 [Drosophila tropicalis]|uniref:small cysteine and glycine repeat-containing protein 6 n=1 Tax=Drosophila tropicalis TaxID=46794 RepID=UPI0035AC035E